ncbi:hypothetical protein V5O48_018698, partial [Marasmius crinis-equi]
PFPGFSERKWMQILFAAPICEVCGARNIQTVDMYMRQRICRKCVQDTSRAVTVHQYRVANPNLELPKFTLICSLVLPTRCSPTHGWSRTKFVEYYPVAELNKVRDEVEASHNADEYIAQRRTSVEELRVRIRAYEIWVKGYRAAVAKQKDMERKAPIEARREAIKRRMVQLGFTEEEYKHVRELPAVAKKTPLYEEDWSIVEPIVTLAIVRIRLRAASTFRLLEVLYAEIKLSLRPIEYRAYPLLANIVDISALPSDFPSLYQLGLGPSISKPVVDAIRDEFLADLQRFARTKKERIRKHIVREADTLLGADNEGELPLEETLFAACKEGWVVSGIAEVSGVDPMTTTPDAMDEKGLLFRYKRPSTTWDPSTCAVGPWRKALAHFQYYQDAHAVGMKTVCEVICKEVNEDERDEWGWSCNQCHVNLENLAARRDVVDHLRETFIRSTTVGIDQLGNLEYGGGYSYRILDGIKSSWKIFCQRRIQLEKSWRGGAPSRLVNYPATGYIVHRIKVDEKNGFIIASTGFPLFEAQGAPALIVADMKNPDRILWSLPSTFVKQYAHIEYENGFLIFDRLSGQKEVWRLASVKDPHPPPAGEDIDKLPIPYPQKDQLSASFEAAASYTHTFPRGHFVPHALLNMPRKTRAFRFVYPTLLVGGFNHAFCFDVPSRQLVQTINPTQQPTMTVREEGRSDSETTVLPQLGELNYVELSPRHVFICGENSLRVFSRETGGCMLDFPSSFRSYGHRTIRVLGVGKDASDEETEDDRREREQYGRSREDSWSLIGVNTEVGEGKKASVVARLKTVEVNPEPEDHRSVLDEFTAVHVSACGNHLVAMLRTSRLVVIRNFSSIPFRTNRTNGEQYTQLLKENTIQIALGTQHSVSQYLAFDRGKVVAVS